MYHKLPTIFEYMIYVTFDGIQIASAILRAGEPFAFWSHFKLQPWDETTKRFEMITNIFMEHHSLVRGGDWRKKKTAEKKKFGPFFPAKSQQTWAINEQAQKLDVCSWTWFLHAEPRQWKIFAHYKSGQLLFRFFSPPFFCVPSILPGFL